MGKKLINGLTPKQEKFCQLYARDRDCFGNGTQAYKKAFKPKKTYGSIRTEAYKLLTNPRITERIRELLDIYISDEVVDKELGEVILQSGDLSAKVSAIREYNKVKGRLAPTTFKFVDENDDLTDEELEKEIAKRKKS